MCERRTIVARRREQIDARGKIFDESPSDARSLGAYRLIAQMSAVDVQDERPRIAAEIRQRHRPPRLTRWNHSDERARVKPRYRGSGRRSEV
jgi:hypothetical protein